MSSNTAAPRTLDLAAIDFSGVHLIEASAGTGKTYNITRLFVRALLEKKLAVADILVVTFTEAATQELRGRIGEYLSDLCHRWGQPSQDTFEQWLFDRHDANEARLALTLAVQDLDRAEIHTIHGFCSRVLREQAFQSGEPFDQQVEKDGARLLLEATRDVYRGLVEDEALFDAVTYIWPTPEACVDDLRAPLENPLISLPQARPFDLPDEHALGKLMAEVRQSVTAALETDSNKNKGRYTSTAQKFADWMARFEPVLEAHLADDGRVSHRVLGKLIRLGELPKAGNSNLFKPLLQEDAPLGRLKALLEAYQAYRKGSALGHVVREVRARTEYLRRQRNVLDFSAMIHRVHQAVAHQPDAPLTLSLAERYPVMLVDEFQDTDSAQFDIFYTLARSRAGNCLFMIGDPKQAIYSFRGGDVHTYLRARAEADLAWTLDGNWRSTPDMVEAYNRLFSYLPNTFGESGITYEPVKARKSQQELGEIVDEGGHQAALQIPVLEVPDTLRERKKDGSLKEPPADAIRAIAAQWCAQEARRLLQQARLRTSEGERPLQGKDLAFLVRSHAHAEEVIRALKAVGLTAASAKSKKTVFESTEAQHLRLFLRGVLYAEQESCFLTALATPWVGLDAQSLYTLPEQAERWQQWYERFAQWRTLWQRGRLLAMLHEAFFGCEEHPEGYRIASEQAHRSVTNLFHLAELMQAEALNRPAPEDQLDWLEAAMAHPKSQPEGAELRLERDDDVITVMTLHGAKGLEFPVVFLPFADTKPPPLRGKTCVIPQDKGLQVDYLEDDLVKERHAQEVSEENMRLFYVALTRPIYRCYMPWLGVEASSGGKSTSIFPPVADALGGTGVHANLVTLAEQSPRALHVTEPMVMDPKAPQEDDASVPSSGPGVRPEAREFNGKIDRHWRVLSFTALARGLHEPEQQVRPERDDEDVASTEPPQPLPLRFRMRPGAQTGEILHALLEHADFTRPDWPALVETWAQGAGLDSGEQDELAQWMDEVIRAPVPLSDDTVKLADLTHECTLREAEFFFPAHAPVPAIERALSRWRGGQPVRLMLDTVTGMMRGFIDLIFEAHGRYWVADYKSTWLGAELEDYSADAIARNMQAHHYDLQGLIYTVALHRLLQQRLPSYEPARHLGGMVYLYMRGMAPEGGTGVHVQPVPADVLAQWDALFAGEEVPS